MKVTITGCHDQKLIATDDRVMDSEQGNTQEFLNTNLR